MYLTGRVDVSPTYGVPISLETDKILPGLIRLHEYGLLSTDSQPGGAWGPNCTLGRGWVQFKQRPYFQFLVPTVHRKIEADKVKKLIELLLKHEKIVTSVWSDCHDYPRSSDGSVNEAREVAPTTYRDEEAPGDEEDEKAKEDDGTAEQELSEVGTQEVSEEAAHETAPEEEQVTAVEDTQQKIVQDE